MKISIISFSRAAGAWWLPGSIAVAAIALLTIAPLIAMITSAKTVSADSILLNPYYLRVIHFSLYQALLSTALSIALAIPVARALSREPAFPGRHLLINLYSLSLVIPTIVAIFGIVAVFGRTGWINSITGLAGIKPFSIYGLDGILLAHVFFNMPLATRVLLQALDGIPAEQWRLATQLRMNSLAQFRYLEWPAISSQLAGISMLIFTLCFTSFTIVMTLGGGPAATTIEVAIYQALRFEFDLGTAVSLAIVQLLLCTLLMTASALFKQSPSAGFNYTVTNNLYLPRQHHRWLNAIVIIAAALFVILPLAGLVASAANPAFMQVITHALTLKATFNTVFVAISVSILTVVIGVMLLSTTRHLRIRLEKQSAGVWLQLSGNAILLMPPVVLGTGLFILLRPHADVFSLALLLAILINSLMALPFTLRILDGPIMLAAKQHDKLIQSLGIRGWNRWRLIDWPVLRRPIGLAMAMSATLAAGDLSAIALFGSERTLTLPLLLYQRMGSYRLHEAAVTAFLLMLLCLCLFLLLQRVVGGGRNVSVE